ncbi:methyltransferase type 11 [Shewanella mangrovi]|uniref:Methyltransferase type 11 n=1 Tax=Shewanella mangrovi TaxID=1515746 RepID=A0A094LQ50_9GAMM|nr:class I SAM-dependent methyltransferase [Shewanella mangrovi]KFZ37268.1 methyltransferase type 11 [Shewanella mangrovi]
MSSTTESLWQGWEALPNGPQLLAEVDNALEEWWPRIFGYHLLKLGALSLEMTSSASKINHTFTLFPDHRADVVADFDQLPLKSCSVDAVLMPLLLEFEQDPYRILREVDRVLVSGGYLVICGINPFSSAYTGKLFPQYQNRWPWYGRFFMPARVKDWLGLLGYQLVADERLGFHSFLPDWNYPRLCRQWQQRLLPGTGSLYLFIARKLDTPLTPIAPKNKKRVAGWQPAATGGFSGRNMKQSDHK